MRKKKFKEFLKKKWKWLVTGGFFLFSGLIILLVGFYITGWSIIDWLYSPYATTMLILLLVGGVILIMMLLEMKRQRLGDGE
ncbi:MAG: hypothetical protein M0Q41_10715 [Bacteroidales bacterium]|nr:hypothetical protein [Acholeplasmataceae bacterium]MCK9449433.1 hypothetical protein [Bacteroidales bacterium]